MSKQTYVTINLSVSNEKIISTEDAFYHTETGKTMVPTIVLGGTINGIKKQLHTVIDRMCIGADGKIQLWEEKINE